METQKQETLYESMTMTDDKAEWNQVQVPASGCYDVVVLVEGVWGRREIAVDAGRPQWEDEIGARITERANVQFGSEVTSH
jgi:hypothetical protein